MNGLQGYQHGPGFCAPLAAQAGQCRARRELIFCAHAAAAGATHRPGYKTMSHHKSREVVLPIKMTPELHAALDALRDTWRRDPAAIPRGLTCSQSKEGAFVVTAAESVFVTLPGACVVKGLGAIELVGIEPIFEPGAGSKTLVLRDTEEGWRFSVKFVPPIVRERNTK
ncbi:MAG: hypothetical protein IPH41_03180 [Sulfuritalea sp.]|nr:hypothetical protein [Sulfuritalea sp.]